MNEEKLLTIRIKLSALETRVFGMVAENKDRETHGYSVAWTQVAFDEMADRMEKLVKDLEEK